MCGRFTLVTDFAIVAGIFKAAALDLDIPPRCNIAPGQEIPVITARDEGRLLSVMRWGLIPSWADHPRIGYQMINARGETVATKPAFRQAFARRRCLIPADGFYEWRLEGTVKQPYRITLPDETVFAMAGIWEQWLSPQGITVASCSIITTAANPQLQDIHHRMPVIFPDPGQCDTWLRSGESARALQALLRPYPGALTVYAVSTAVNSARQDHPGLMAPLNREQPLRWPGK